MKLLYLQKAFSDIVHATSVSRIGTPNQHQRQLQGMRMEALPDMKMNRAQAKPKLPDIILVAQQHDSHSLPEAA